MSAALRRKGRQVVKQTASMRLLRRTLERRLRGAARVVLLSVGSDLRGDDAAGPLAGELLGKRRPARLSIVDGAAAPENQTGVIRELRPTHLVVVDAVEMGRRLGTIALVPIAELTGEAASTHRLPLSLTLGYLARELGCEVLFIGIQPGSTLLGAAMNPEVVAAAEDVARLLQEILEPVSDSSRGSADTARQL